MEMGEELAQKAISLTCRGAKLTGRLILKMIMRYLRHRKTKSSSLEHGLQSVKDLAKHGQGMTTLDMNDENIKLFHKTMKQYGVNYAVTTNKETTPPTHTIFFHAKDADAITHAFKEYASLSLKKTKNQDKTTSKEEVRPSVLAKLRDLVAKNKANKNKSQHKVKTPKQEPSR